MEPTPFDGLTMDSNPRGKKRGNKDGKMRKKIKNREDSFMTLIVLLTRGQDARRPRQTSWGLALWVKFGWNPRGAQWVIHDKV